jgi:RHS repeat-associated protein
LDDNGNLVAMTDAAGSSSWTYDENNRVIAESRTQNGTTKTAGYAYHANGTLDQLTTFAGQTVSFAYDNALRLTGQTDPNAGGGMIGFGHDQRGRRTTITYPSGVKQLQTFDVAGRVASITLEQANGSDLQTFTYSYGLDANGNQTSAYRAGNVVGVSELSGATVAYTYDALLRLTGAVRTTNATFNHTYAYDLADNRTAFNAASSTHDGANQMVSHRGSSLSYDRNGNTLSYGANSYTYNAANQWTGASIGGTAYAYTYDGLGRQVSRSQSGTRTDFWFDRSGMTLETGGSARTYLRDPSGLPLSVKAGSTLSNVGRDRLGSITGLTSTAQALSGTLTYDPWGRPEATSGNAADSNLRFAGSHRDPGTGYHQMGVRTYQYAWARFTTLDPLPASITDLNRYAYAGCNPANYVDPTGLSPQCWLAAAEAALFLGGVAVSFLPGGAVIPSLVIGLVGVGTGAASIGFSIGDEDRLGTGLGLTGLGTGLFAILPGFSTVSLAISGVNAAYGVASCLTSD